MLVAQVQSSTTSVSLSAPAMTFAKLLLDELHARFDATISSRSWPTVAAALSPTFANMEFLTDADTRKTLFSDIATFIAHESVRIDQPLRAPFLSAAARADASDDEDDGQRVRSEVDSRRKIVKVALATLRDIARRKKNRTPNVQLTEYITAALQERNEDIDFWRAVHAGDMAAAQLDGLGWAADEMKNVFEQLRAFEKMFSSIIRGTLSYPASSAPSERVFSAAGWLLDQRSSLDVHMIESLLVFREWSRSQYTDPVSCKAFVERLAENIYQRRA